MEEEESRWICDWWELDGRLRCWWKRDGRYRLWWEDGRMSFRVQFVEMEVVE